MDQRDLSAGLVDHEMNVRVEVIAGAGHLSTPTERTEIFARSTEFYGGDIGRPDQENS